MRTGTKVWLVIAAALVLLGCILFAGVMSKLNWDFTKLSTVQYETNTYEVSDAFDGISIDTDTADIVFALSGNGKCRVECHEEEKAKHFVAVEDNTLVIKMVNRKSWYEYIGVNFGSPKITIYLPLTEYASLLIDGDTSDVEIPKNFTFKDVHISLSTGVVYFGASASEKIKIKTSTGDIRVENISAGTLDLSVSTGKVTVSSVTCQGDVTVGVSTGKADLTDISCKSLTSSGNTGDISLVNVIAAERFSIERSTGDVKFNSCDAAAIYVKTDTGDVNGTLLSDKVFITETDTGSINVPNSITGGRCEITTDTGDIKMKVIS